MRTKAAVPVKGRTNCASQDVAVMVTKLPTVYKIL